MHNPRRMNWFPESQDHLPLTWWKQKPIYLAAILAIGTVASMVLTALLMAAFGSQGVEIGVFTVGNVIERFWVWTPLTYILINPPSIWLLLTAFLLWRFGESVERHLGRRVFVKLVLLLVLVQPVLLGLVALTGLRNVPAMGMSSVSFGIFLAFVTLYPSAQISLIILTIEAWIFATAVVAVSALVALAGHDWIGLLLLAGEVGVAVGYTRYETGLWTPSLNFWPQAKARPNLQSVPRAKSSKPKPSRSASEPDSPTREAIDAILDKISRTGIASLTPEEKRKLEIASKR